MHTACIYDYNIEDLIDCCLGFSSGTVRTLRAKLRVRMVISVSKSEVIYIADSAVSIILHVICVYVYLQSMS